MVKWLVKLRKDEAEGFTKILTDNRLDLRTLALPEGSDRTIPLLGSILAVIFADVRV